MAENVFSPDAWTRARNRFVEDLTDEEQRVFSQASPEAILYDASAAEKTHRATSTTTGVVKKIQPFIEAVEQYGAALDVYSNIYPLVMGPIWGSVRVVLHLARESHKYFEKLADMFNRISDVLPRLRIYETLFPTHERLVQSLSKIYFDVLKFCSDAKDVFRRAKRAMFKLAWKPFERQFGSQLDAFRRHQEDMEREVLLSHMIEAADSRALIRSDRVEIAKERYDQERLRVFASLSSAVDYEAKHRKLRGLRHESTGTWLIEHATYVAWKESTASDSVLIHGIPGSGKSVLTSLIVDDLLKGPTRPTQNVLYYYCDYADPPSLHPANVYRALLQQMFLRGLMNEVTVKTVVESLRNNIHALSEQKLISVLCEAVQSCAGLHLVVDGLDECERDSQRAITDTLFRSMAIEQPFLKALVTCRDEGHLLTELSSFNRLQISGHASAADIQSYISYSVASKLSSGELTFRNSALKEEIVAKLSDKAQGMFLWVYFQIIELCDAVSDEGIREILQNLPEGLHDTYTRILKKIAKTGSKTTALKTLMWMVCSRRLLRVEELQEAVAFDAHDKSWNADKIPDADRMIKSCHGLVVRDTENDNVRLAHHTVHQYLVSAQGALSDTGSEGFEESTAPSARVQFWPELSKFRRDPKSAEVLAGTFCATYLCFSDFSTAVSHIRDDKKVELAAAFKDRGPISIPAVLGLGKYSGRLPYMFFGSRNKFKMPEIDYSKYLNVGARDLRPSPDLRKKYAMLEYVIEYWPCHTRWLETSNELGLGTQFWDLVQHGTLAFEFRPWGSNQHFGRYGCRGCPVPEPDELGSKDLSLMGLLHWAAETGHLKVFDIIKPCLQKYLKHERYHDETLLIACHHGQVAVVDILLNCGTFDLSDGRAIIAACASGHALTFHHLLQAQEVTPELKRSPDYFNSVGPRALYQAASNGHKVVVEALLAMKADPSISDAATGLTPLQIAVKKGHSEVVEAFFSLPPPSVPPAHSMDAPHTVSGMKALHYAAEKGFDEIVRLMVLKHGCDCEIQDSRGETPLIKASKNGRAIVAKTLLEGGADPLVRGGENYDVRSCVARFLPNDGAGDVAPRPTAIHHAAANGHENVIAVLPYSDWTCGNEATTALHLGAAYGHANGVQTLLSKRAGVGVKDCRGMTALHYASCNGHKKVVHLLVNKDCQLEARAYTGLTALHMAACSARPEIIRILIAHGAAIGVKTPEEGTQLGTAFTEGGTAFEGSPPLHLAAHYADADTIRTLVDCGALLEEENTIGWTALDEATCSHNLSTVAALIELGAKWLRERVLFYGCIAENPEVAEFLLGKISQSTLQAQQYAASLIEELPVDEDRKLELDDRVIKWRMEWEVSRHLR